MTCVSKKWYFNSKIIVDPYIQCGVPALNSLNNIVPSELIISFINFFPNSFNSEYPCNCREFEFVNLQMPAMLYMYDPTGVYANNYNYRAGTISYNSTTCTATPKCSGTDTLVILSMTGNPKLYPVGTKPPFITCKPTPLASGGTSQYFWIADGNMLAEPVYGCIGRYSNSNPLTARYFQSVVLAPMSEWALITSKDSSAPIPSTTSCHPTRYHLQLITGKSMLVWLQ